MVALVVWWVGRMVGEDGLVSLSRTSGETRVTPPPPPLLLTVTTHVHDDLMGVCWSREELEWSLSVCARQTLRVTGASLVTRTDPYFGFMPFFLQKRSLAEAALPVGLHVHVLGKHQQVYMLVAQLDPLKDLLHLHYWKYINDDRRSLAVTRFLQFVQSITKFRGFPWQMWSHFIISSPQLQPPSSFIKNIIALRLNFFHWCWQFILIKPSLTSLLYPLIGILVAFWALELLGQCYCWLLLLVVVWFNFNVKIATVGWHGWLAVLAGRLSWPSS